MRSSLAVFALLGLAHAITSDNGPEASSVATQAVLLSAGNYYFTNVKSGNTLSFARQGSVTNVYAMPGGAPLAIQSQQGPNPGGSQLRLSGGNNKCLSAQWNAQTEGGVDAAAVSYACKVGSGSLTGTSTLETTKQWWYLVPVPSSASAPSPVAASSPLPSSSSSQAPSSTSQTSTSSSSIQTSSSATSTVAAIPSVVPVQQDSVPNPKAIPVAYAEMSSSSSSLPSTTAPAASACPTPTRADPNPNNKLSGVVVSDRSSWICRHPGWWLARHPGYVTYEGHVECAAELAAAQAANGDCTRMSKRSHVSVARSLQKRGAQQQYFLIAVDHILNQRTRAVTGDSIGTFGGYKSAKLDLWDQSNPSQMWTVTAA